MQLVVTHLLIRLASDRVARGNGMWGIIIVIIRQRTYAVIYCLILHWLFFIIRMSINIGVSLTGICRSYQHVKGIVVKVELGAVIRQGAPWLDGAIVLSSVIILTAKETFAVDIVSIRQVRQYVGPCLFISNFVGINLAVVIGLVPLCQGLDILIFTWYQFTHQHILFLTHLNGVDANHSRGELRLVAECIKISLTNGIACLCIAVILQCHVSWFSLGLTFRRRRHLAYRIVIVVVDLLWDHFAHVIPALSIETRGTRQLIGRTFTVFGLVFSGLAVVCLLWNLCTIGTENRTIPVIPNFRTIHVQGEYITCIMSDVVRRMEELREVCHGLVVAV